VTRTFTVLKGSQTITFGALSSVALGTTPAALTATASSNLAVSFSSNSTGVCTVAGAQITLVSVGTCSISANQAGDASYAAAPAVTQTFAVTQGSQTITFNAPATTTFGTAAFGVTATASSGLPVSFASTTAGVCTVSGSTVTLTGVGTCTLTASQGGDNNYLAATPVSQSFTVNKGSQTITFGTLSGVALGVAPFTISATASSGLAVSFASTTTTICTVSGATVTILDTGVCSIDASQPGNANYLAATSVTRAFNVAAGSQTITFGPLSNVTFGVAPITLTATASSNLTVTFASTTTPVCTVAGNVVTVVGTGTCSITASQAGNASYAAATDVTRTFTVAKGSQTITFAQPASPAAGTTAHLIATSTSGLTVAFASTTPSICTVSGITLSALQTGSCTITASQAGDSTTSPPLR
jgi:hypothetical protein